MQSVKKAETNLGYATITAPIDGIVISKSVEEGQTVAASFNTPELFTIAQDLTNMRVIADIDEADIGEVKEGERVSFTVDAYPDDVFVGVVTQVRLEATTESNVVTYEVVISAKNADMKLKPGLTANVTIFTNEKNNVVSVPTKALKFTPNEKMLTEDQVVKDCKGEHKVWTLDGNTFTAHPVQVGITNGIMTEITYGLKSGQKVITEFKINGEEEMETAQGNNNPFMPKPRQRNNNNNSKK
jgi:HlyD family secretion protein